MESTKTSSTISSDSLSPILIRRRLSAPETVMRKCVLARTASQEIEPPQSNDSKNLLSKNHEGSDLNLNKKKDSSVQMRKSTVFRRFLNNTKMSSFHEWQLSEGKLSTQSLTSLQGSPEHIMKSNSRRSLTGYEFKALNQRSSPVRQSYDKSYISPKRKISLNKNYITINHKQCCGQCMNNKQPNKPGLSKSSDAENDNEKTYSSNTFSDYSDSAYSNSRSDMLLISNPASSSSTSETVQVSNRLEKDSSKDFNKNIHTINESSTQTNKITNLNVISNVQLSQSTLDLIVNQVMKDVHGSNFCETKNVESTTETKIPSTINVQQMPHTCTNPKDKNKLENKIIKYMISKIEAGGPYNSSENHPVVTRFSALPSTTSMEVNTSGGVSDDNSEEESPFDSLEDYKGNINADLSNIPTKSSKSTPKKRKSSNAFFIPLELSKGQLTNKVSDHLPEKVKLKLIERQKKLQERTYLPKEPFLFNKKTENKKCNLSSKNTPRINTKNKANSTESFKSFQIENENTNCNTRRQIKKTYKKDKIQIIFDQKHSTTTKNVQTTQSFVNKDYFYENIPTKIYHKTEFENHNKKIQILEVMEYIQPEQSKIDALKNKSKIPVFINHTPVKNTHKKEKNIKPSYLDLDENVGSDPKLDQLIANLLIQTLNDNFSSDAEANKKELPISNEKENNANLEPTAINKFPGLFESIPEESNSSFNGDQNILKNNNVNNNITKQDSDEQLEKQNNNPLLKNIDHANINAFKRKTAVAVVKEDETIPKGWITFYMLQNNPETTVESTPANEGRIPDNSTLNNTGIDFNNKEAVIHENGAEVTLQNQEIDKHVTSSSEAESQSTFYGSHVKKYDERSRKNKNKHLIAAENSNSSSNNKGEWSITLTGSNQSVLLPSLEMKLYFPQPTPKSRPQIKKHNCLNRDLYNKNQLESNATHLPKISPCLSSKQSSVPDLKSKSYSVQLPEIKNATRQKREKRREVAMSLDSLRPDISEPRQTRTSTTRYHMSRPRMYSLTDSNNSDILTDKQCIDISKERTNSLSVHGNLVAHDKKRLLYQADGKKNNNFY